MLKWGNTCRWTMETALGEPSNKIFVKHRRRLGAKAVDALKVETYTYVDQRPIIRNSSLAIQKASATLLKIIEL